MKKILYSRICECYDLRGDMVFNGWLTCPYCGRILVTIKEEEKEK
jgi:hypothetical protein